jgi:hypothetical protein
MTTFNLRRAQIDGIWGAHPDRDELLARASALPATVIVPASATTQTPHQSLLDLQGTSDSTEI